MINFSTSTAKDLQNFIKQKSFRKIFVITGKKSYNFSNADSILNNILKNKITKYYFKNLSYPDFSELTDIILSIRSFKPDIILAVGGGTVIDYAKIANVLEIDKSIKNNIKNSSYKIKKKFCKLVAIPTTAGTGAEVTANAVIYINKIKYSVESEILKPDYFFLIPQLIINSSRKIKSSTGFDAIAQAVESLISKKSNKTSINYAKKSLDLSLNYYLSFLNKPNKTNTSAMCVAANLSGKAISISKTTAPHAVSYPFTSFYNISHGHAVSITLNKFLKFNYKNIQRANCDFDLNKRYELLFQLTGSKNINDLDSYIQNLKKQAKLNDNFIKLGIDIKSGYSKIIEGVNIKRLSNNPINIKKKDIKDILFE